MPFHFQGVGSEKSRKFLRGSNRICYWRLVRWTRSWTTRARRATLYDWFTFVRGSESCDDETIYQQPTLPHSPFGVVLLSQDGMEERPSGWEFISTLLESEKRQSHPLPSAGRHSTSLPVGCPRNTQSLDAAKHCQLSTSSTAHLLPICNPTLRRHW